MTQQPRPSLPSNVTDCALPLRGRHAAYTAGFTRPRLLRLCLRHHLILHQCRSQHVNASRATSWHWFAFLGEAQDQINAWIDAAG